MRSALAFVLVGMLAACATPMVGGTGILSSQQIWDRHHELDGSLLEVRGWLQYCAPLGCRIADGPTDRNPGLSIGSSSSFDRSTKELIGREIVVRATLDAECLHAFADPTNSDGKIVICTDRSEMLKNPQLVRFN